MTVAIFYKSVQSNDIQMIIRDQNWFKPTCESLKILILVVDDKCIRISHNTVNHWSIK